MIGRPNRVGSVTRWTVSCNIECAPNNGKNCLGRPSREAGHSRVPAPPHMIRGMIVGANSCLQQIRSKAAHEVRASDSVLYRLMVPQVFAGQSGGSASASVAPSPSLSPSPKLTVVGEEYIFWQK